MMTRSRNFTDLVESAAWFPKRASRQKIKIILVRHLTQKGRRDINRQRLIFFFLTQRLICDQGWSSVSYRRDLGMLKLQGRTNWKSRIKAQERAIRSSGPGFAWLKVRDKNWVKDIRGGADWVQQVAMQVVGIQEGQEALRLKYWIYHPCRQ